jgi:hypothetical protein
MEDILEILKKNRPNLSGTSLKTYLSTLKNIYKKIYPNDDKIDIKKYFNYKDFLDFLKDMDGSKRKTILSSLVVLCGDEKCKDYRDVMIDDAKKYNLEQKEQKATSEQKENWISQDEIKNIYNKYESQAKKLLKEKNLNMGMLQQIQNWIIICLTSGIFIDPRRSTDWTEMKISNYTSNDNFYNKKEFVFNKYKTAKIYKTQKIDVPDELRKILKKWISINPTNYLLFDTNSNPLSPVKLTQRNNNIYGNKVSVNMLRHSYITEKYVDNKIPNLKNMLETSNNMGHSLNQHLEYIKLDGDEKKEDAVKEEIKESIKKEKKRLSKDKEDKKSK